jgi:hypothetical protein
MVAPAREPRTFRAPVRDEIGLPGRRLHGSGLGRCLAQEPSFTPSWTVLGTKSCSPPPDDVTGNWTGMWYHDGFVWAVSGVADAATYAHQLIDQQAATGREPEPQQVDIDVLEGPLRPVGRRRPRFHLRLRDPLPTC